MATVRNSKTKTSKPTWLHARATSFGYAIKGLSVLFQTQPHAKIHLGATLTCVALGFYLNVSIVEWALLSVSVTIVWAAEGFNTAIEFFVDRVHPEWHEDAGRVKDVAAGAVLVCAIGALAVGILIFGPKVLDLTQIP